MHEGAHQPEQQAIAAKVTYFLLLTKSLVCALSFLTLHMHKMRVCVYAP